MMICPYHHVILNGAGCHRCTEESTRQSHADQLADLTAELDALRNIFGRISCAVAKIDGKGDNTSADDVIVRIAEIGKKCDSAIANVTDEMIEAAFRIYGPASCYVGNDDSIEKHKELMRAAIEAALAVAGKKREGK